MQFLKIATIASCLLILNSTLAYGDYSCVCNYNVETSVFSTVNEHGSPIGYMYEFDCKQKLESEQGQQGWFKIAFEHQIGYVKQDVQVQLQLCPGDPSPDEIVPTNPAVNSTTPSVMSSSSSLLFTSPSSSGSFTSSFSTKLATQSHQSNFYQRLNTTTTKITSSSQAPVITILPETKQTKVKPSESVFRTLPTSLQNTFSSGSGDHCSDRVKSFALSNQGVIAQFDSNCYVLIKTPLHWLEAELSCKTERGHLVHIGSQEQQSFIYSFLKNHYNHSIWIGLSDKQNEAHFQWSSGQQFYFVNWADHTHFSDTREDCVVMDMHLHDGKWDDRECDFEFYPYICQYALAGAVVEVTTQPYLQNSSSGSAFFDGNTELCPSQIKSDATFQGAILGQFERGCYELLLQSKVSWEHGENICQSKGGHLAHISNRQQQAFVESFMQRHNPDHAVWLGLHDTKTEGTFQWTAGTSVQFTNWIPGHSDNTLGGHNYEDCVTFVPQRQGYWDDVHCGYEEIFGHDSGETHYAFCQYKIHSAVSVIG